MFTRFLGPDLAWADVPEAEVVYVNSFAPFECTVPRTLARFVNHACEPNAEIRPDRALARMGIYVFNAKFLYEQVTRDSGEPRSHFLLGQSLARLSREREAVASFRRCLELSPDHRTLVKTALQRLLPLSVEPWILATLLGEIVWLEVETARRRSACSLPPSGPPARRSRALPLMVVAPVPWFPFQGLIRLFRPHFRPVPPYREIQDGIEVLHPRFFSIPGLCKSLDGFFLALGTLPLLRRLKRERRCDIIDSHFAYPEGYAASLLGRWLALPFTVTLRGTESRLAQKKAFQKRMVFALQSAARVFSVSDSLRRIALSLGIPESSTQVVGNGVDTMKLHGVDKSDTRVKLGLPPDAPVLISIGGLVERKGSHRVIDCLPKLLEGFPALHYLIVGGPSPEGDMGTQLHAQVSISNPSEKRI